MHKAALDHELSSLSTILKGIIIGELADYGRTIESNTIAHPSPHYLITIFKSAEGVPY